MSVDRLKRDLLNKLINARIDLAAYLQLRKAKGYMSVSESEHLRDNLFELCNFMREQAPTLKAEYDECELMALRRAAEVLSIAGVCLMNGLHDCPNFIAVNAEKLENCLTTLSLCIMCLNKHETLAQH
ncbi:biofilm formation regulator BssR [Enterobacter bugandensis]|uniref:biofilm formation regulator BssR n=1 Tax=Enterobacter bugandensis TaxID=881260 RepID=UPI0020049BFD|nr:biofilm formation regulator BssR [Enterobacter bugandensis]MCK6733709.1 biofilm formation regulator BssR [Enterobacter bugandensis]HCM9225264.1 biofilm formation regulator BssR [Enterobacter bugandensis]